MSTLCFIVRRASLQYIAVHRPSLGRVVPRAEPAAQVEVGGDVEREQLDTPAEVEELLRPLQGEGVLDGRDDLHVA